MMVSVKTQLPPWSRKSCTPKQIRRECNGPWSVHANMTPPSTSAHPNHTSDNVCGRVLFAAKASLRLVLCASVVRFLYPMGCEC
jgi:hypothetical protein